MGISTQHKHLITFLPENKKYGAKPLLKCFLTKTGVLVDWKRSCQKIDNTSTVVCRIGYGSTSHCPHSTCVVNFFISLV